jgi:ABC-2 type transport system ATP-binding protein
MSVEIVKLSKVGKVYGSQRALSGVDLSVPNGQVLGLLGPNGAGKSTLMRLITGYLPATEGEVEVAGLSVARETEKTRALVGYLPEHNPLYLEMYVREYLEFVAGLHRLKEARKRVEEVIVEVGLSPEAHKQIGQLSKGYRQRVGLAQALIHRPEVLILDEPTSGLDPNQLDEIRALIRNVGRDRTVILSTHIMQEVEAMCDRVVLIRKGQLVADAPTAEFAARPGGLEGAFRALTAE